MNASKTIQHLNPVWREKADFILFAELSNAGLPGNFEQMWAARVGIDEFSLCCVPFLTYGLALGDVVKTTSGFGKNYVISARVQASGHLVYRAWFGEVNLGLKREYRFQAVVKCQIEGWLFEWHSDNLLAIDLPGAEFKQRFDDVFKPLLDSGVLFERG